MACKVGHMLSWDIHTLFNSFALQTFFVYMYMYTHTHTHRERVKDSLSQPTHRHRGIDYNPINVLILSTQSHCDSMLVIHSLADLTDITPYSPHPTPTTL